MVKKLMIGVVIVIALLAGTAHYLWSNLDSIVKAAIEKYGTAAIQTEVQLDSVKILVSSGEGSLAGLTIGNPNGFNTSRALYMGAISMKLDTSSIMGNGPVVIREIIIEKPQVTYEISADGRNNLQAIEHNAMAYASASNKGNGGNSGGSGKPERKIIINDLYIRDGQIGINQALLPDKVINAPLPMIHLTNIGKDKGGATSAQIAEQVLGSVTSSAARVASANLGKTLGDTLKGAAGKGAGDIGGQLKGLLGGR